MAKGYHVLAGFCRDLRNAVGDAAEGSATAKKLVDDFNDLLDVLDDGSDGELPIDEDGDEPACGDAAESEDVSMVWRKREEGTVRGLGGAGQSPALHSTRARIREERRPKKAGVLCASGEVRYPTRTGSGGKR